MDIIGGTPTGPGGNVKDATDQTFMEDVIEASNEAPVLVDFWAPWCGPCKTLGPVIEKVVDSHGGKVKLVKVNIDENQGIAGQLGVRSIPAVFAFDKGRPVDGFMGALPESQIRGFIDKILSGTDVGKQIEEALDQAVALFQSGDVGGAAQLYAAIINQDPANLAAIAGLARCYLANDDADRARQTLEMVPEDQKGHPDVKSVMTALEFSEKAGDAPIEAAIVESEPASHEERLERAETLAGQNQHEEAANLLFAILEDDLDWQEGAAKAQLLKVFEAAGEKSPVTQKGRRRLSGLVFR